MLDVDTSNQTEFPRILDVGLGGVLVTFSEVLTDTANGAALAFRDAVDNLRLDGVLETSTSLTSTFVTYDPLAISREALRDHLKNLAEDRDWTIVSLPKNRSLWTIPAVFGGAETGPQLEEAAKLAGVPAEVAITELCAKPLRVMTLGFAPGQPYLGSLPENWGIPRQTGLTKSVPVGAITVAIRQIVLFATSTPTGWRHIGQCGFRAFRPDREDPFALKPGDALQFRPVGIDEYNDIQARDRSGDGGSTRETMP